MVKRLTNPLQAREQPLGNLLSTAGRRLFRELDITLHAAGFDDVRAAHYPVFMAIDPEGTPSSVLASRAGMTKQAMGELVRHLTARGYLDTIEDAADRRVRTVRLTERGWRAVDATNHVIDDFDAWLDSAVGADRVAQMRHTLELVIDAERREW